MNAYNCYLMWNIGCKYSDSPLIIQYDKRTAPLFLAILGRDSHHSAAVGPQSVPFSRLSTPPRLFTQHALLQTRGYGNAIQLINEPTLIF